MSNISNVNCCGCYKIININKNYSCKICLAYNELNLCNKESSIRKYAEKAGFDINRIQLIEGRPEYLRISALTYPLGILYERIMNSSNLFSKFRVVIQMEMQKRDR